MMRHVLRGVPAIALLLALSTPLLMAQDASKRTLVLIGAGTTMPQGDFEKMANNGYHAAAGVQSRLRQGPLGIRADAMYATGDMKDLPVGASASWHITTLAVGLQLEASRGAAQPYVFGQWAYYNFKAKASMLGQSFSETLEKGGISAGGGVRFAVGRARLYAEARYGFASEADGDVKFVPLTIGITF